MGKALEISENNFQDEVLNSQEPVLIDFWASWCGPCQRLGPVIDELAGEYEGKVKVGKINVDENQNLAAQFGVSSIPVVLFFKGGEVVDQHMGLAPKDTYTQKLEALV